MEPTLTYELDDTGNPGSSPERRNVSGEEGFSLIETTCAMVIILIALLGVAFSFTYAINYNAGNQSRTECLAVLQQEVEQMRAAKFTPSVTDVGLRGGIMLPRTIISPTGKRFLVTISVDNDPNTAGIQSDTDVPLPTIKEVTISAKLEAPSPGWQISVPSTIVLRRVRAN